MKKHVFALGFAGIMAAAAVTGCGGKKEAPTTAPEIEVEMPSRDIPFTEPAIETEPEAEEAEETGQIPDYEACYNQVLNKLVDYINYFDDYSEPGEGQYGVEEIVRYEGSEEAMNIVGYSFVDLNKDGMPELVIGNISEWNNDIPMGSTFLSGYTLQDGNPVLLFEGWARNSYRLLDNVSESEIKILNSGSSGAAYSSFGTWVMDEAGTGLACEDFYFSDLNKKGEIVFFHNHTGEWEHKVSEKLDISSDEFFAMEDELIAREYLCELTPLKDYEYDYNIVYDGGDESGFAIQVWPADEFDSQGMKVEQFVAEDGEYAATLVFCTCDGGGVNNFAFGKLNDVNVNNDGYFTYETDELYKKEYLGDSDVVEVTLVFHGDMPEYYVSFEDETGETQVFAVELSGYDGSPSLLWI